MPRKATLIHPQTRDKKVVEANSPESRKWEAQGYVLMTATGEPITAGKPAEQPTTQTDVSSFLAGIGIQPKGEQYDQEAQMWQYLTGGDMRENPYLAYIEPRVIEEGGKRFLRIPKNQTLLDLAGFFEGRRATELGLRGDIASDFFGYRKDKFNEELGLGEFGLDVREQERKEAETLYDIGKPEKPTVPTTITPTEDDTDTRQFSSVDMKTTASGGLAFFGKAERGGQPQPISMFQYAQETNEEIEDILAKSKDPQDAIVLDETNKITQMIDDRTITAEEGLTSLQAAYPHIFGIIYGTT